MRIKLSLLLSTTLLLTSLFLIAQTEQKTIYPVAVSFNSQCCGVPSDSSLRIFISAFKRKYKIKKISAFEYGPLGREGEYCLAFNLKELNKKQSACFISEISKIKTLPSDKGTFSIDVNYEIDMSSFPKRASKKDVIF